MKQRDKFHYFLFILLLLLLTTFTPSIVSNKIERIYKDTSSSISSSGIPQCYTPQIYVDFENNIHTTWTSTGESFESPIQKYNLVYTNKSVNSTHWSELRTIYTPNDNIFSGAEFVVDKKENIHLVWKETLECQKVYYRLWNASKNKWTHIDTISDFDEVRSRDPKILVDDKFNVHVVWSDDSYGFDPNILYRCKNATYGTWQSIEILTIENNSSMRHSPTITIDNDYNIAVAWIDEGKVRYKLRYNENGSWTNSRIISTFSGNSDDPTIKCDAENNMHFTWMDWDYHPEVHYAKHVRNTDYIPDVMIFRGDRVNNPSMILDQYGNIHVAWESGDSSDVDIWYGYKKASSLMWKIEIASKESTYHSKDPSISVGTNDILHFVWSDLTSVNNSDSLGYNTFYKYKNLTSGEWSSTFVLFLSVNDNHYELIFFILLGSYIFIFIASLRFFIIRKRKFRNLS